MPFAVQAIRKLGETGHSIVAADTFATAPGSHSRHVDAAVVTPAPTDGARGYVTAIAEIIAEHGVERVLPSFEEVFYLARFRAQLDGHAELFFPEFELLAALHDKVRFSETCAQLGLAVAPSRVARDRAELDAATQEFDEFFARPAYSRGGLELYTNHGELAGALRLSDCDPTPGNPWLVQPFVAGEDRCAYAIAQHGRLTAHVAYVHPRTIDGAGGILFESIDDPELLEASRRVIEATGYHGQIAFDFLRVGADARGSGGARTLVVECNPRATAGVALLTAEEFDAALSDPLAANPVIAPAGRRRKISAAIVRQMLQQVVQHPWGRTLAQPRALGLGLVLDGIRALRDGGEDLYATLDDPMPGLFQLLSYVHVLRYRNKPNLQPKRSKLMAAYLHDLRWDGEPLGEGPRSRGAW